MSDNEFASHKNERAQGSDSTVGPSGRTVQEYIDETPFWSDGTEVASTPMTTMQWRIWGMATAGKFFEGMVIFMTGVALPLIGREFGLSAAQNGVVAAAALFRDSHRRNRAGRAL